MHQRKEALREGKGSCPVCLMGFKTLFKLKEHFVSLHSTNMGNKLRKCVVNCEERILDNKVYDHILFTQFLDEYTLNVIGVTSRQ